MTLINRRAAIAGGVAGSVGLALGWQPAFAAADLPQITKVIPSSGEKLPVVGIGTNQYSVTGAEDIAARREVLANLPKLGGKVVDTAFGYGDSEVVIGNLVKDIGNRDKLFIATKTPNRGDVPAAAKALEQAFTRLQTQKLDLLQIHNFHGINELFPALLESKKARKVRYVGVTT